jgi:predicted branched-subunit amino acid permease
MSRTRTSLLAGVRDISPLIPAGVSFGLIAGAAVTQAGLGLAESLGLSAGVYGAAAQLAATTLWAEGAPLLVIVGTALVINARFFIYSASIAHVLPTDSWWEAAILGYLVRDGAYAATMTRAVPNDEIDVKPYFVGAAVTDWSVWLLFTSLGALGAAFVPETWSLDFIVPLVFVALLAGALRTRTDVETALVAACASVVLVPLLPLQTGLLVAILAGMAWGYVRDRDGHGEVL